MSSVQIAPETKYFHPNMNGALFNLEVAPNEPHPMALLLEEFDQELLEPQLGEIRTGTVVDKRANELLIDIGYKSEGVVSGREIDRVRETVATLNVGDDVSVFIVREEDDGTTVLSISRAQAEKDWQRAEDLLANQEMFEGKVAASNRGGVIIQLGQVRGFVPASQLSTNEHPRSDEDSDEGDDRWSHLMNESLMLKVIDLDRKRNRLILSERLAMREWRRHQKEKLLATLEEGAVLEGTINSIADFGAFVDLGGADGLIHLSELSWSRISHPSEVVKVGQKLKVQVLSVDLERKRIGLSLRRMEPEPWETIEDRYEVGQIVRCTITKLVNFGAFARIVDDEIEGLVHISELSDQRVSHPNEVLAEGEEHELRIIRIDTDRRRMGLSLKQAQPQIQIDWQIAPSDETVENNGNGNGNANGNGRVDEYAEEEMLVAADD